MFIAGFVVAASLVALALAYEVNFTRATLEFGRFLSGRGAGTGFQDAIRPPVSATFALLTYGATLAIVVLAFVVFGVAKAALLLVLFIIVVIAAMFLLPSPASPHFIKLITGSMIRRHADYLRDGDVMRAAAMAELLNRAGLPVPTFTGTKPKD